MLPFANVLWFARAGSRLSSGFLLPGISLGCTRTHVCVCELVLVQAHTACLQRRARATRRPARRWYRHGAAGWAALGAGDGLALTTCLQSALWRTWRHKWIETVQSIIITGSRQQAGRQEGLGVWGLRMHVGSALRPRSEARSVPPNHTYTPNTHLPP